MTKQKVSPQIKKILNSIKNKRAEVVIQHIIEHGFITTEQLEKDYGYNHPPRAARDVREAGIPLETYRVKSSDGRSIASYKFGDLSKITKGKLHGRQVFPITLKEELYVRGAKRCYICSGNFKKRYLQIDHRIPYEISGDTKNDKRNSQEFMLLCGSCNRAKSWSCEHCKNWQEKKDPLICANCYWAHPLNYDHIAEKDIRRIDIQWEGDEIKVYERLKSYAEKYYVELPEFVKKILAKTISPK